MWSLEPLRAPLEPPPHSSKGVVSHLPGGAGNPGNPAQKIVSQPWWWNLLPIKPNPQGKPDTEAVENWLWASGWILQP